MQQIIHLLFPSCHCILIYHISIIASLYGELTMYKGTILNAISKVTTQWHCWDSNLGILTGRAKAPTHYFVRQKCKKLTLQITVWKFSFPRAMVLRIWSLEQEDRTNTNSWSLTLTSWIRKCGSAFFDLVSALESPEGLVKYRLQGPSNTYA